MNRRQLALVLAVRRAHADDDLVAIPSFSLAAQTVAEDAALNTVIGAFTPSNLGALTVSSYAITADPDSKFNISGSNLRVNGALDYETATSHSVTVRMTLSDASTVDRTFAITVTDVSEGVAPALKFNITSNSMYIGQVV